MPKPQTSLPSSRKHLLLFDEDWAFLSRAYGPGSASAIGVSSAIRQIIHTWCLRQREAANRAARPQAPVTNSESQNA